MMRGVRIPCRLRSVLASKSAPLSHSIGIAGRAGSVRPYHFASTKFRECFGDLPLADGQKLRSDTIHYLKSFDSQAWYADPVTTVLDGVVLGGGSEQDTTDAFGAVNGRIRYATSSEVDSLVNHMRQWKPSKTDWRTEMRALELELFEKHSDALIGNQALDFHKQDGVTEIEESVQANLVEHRLNDQLLEDELAGKIVIDRAPAFVGCVSNFTNFLDLFRKTMRNVELGVPVVVLSRSNTTQHMYRWFQILSSLMQKHGVEQGMVSYASTTLEDQIRMFKDSPSGNLYLTASREIAAKASQVHHSVIASTGGPNTLCAPQMTPEIAEAIRMSAMIENSGQCTALRHACIGNASQGDLAQVFESAPILASSQEALEKGEFAGVLKGSPFQLLDGYQSPPSNPSIAYRLNTSLPEGIKEQWRQVYVDMTTTADFGSDAQINELAAWLVKNQPISLAMNTVDNDFAYAKALFAKTAQVVYTVGHQGAPALTCQARPQEGEVFGEFPVRRELRTFTKYPVVVPSPTPMYNSTYSADYLKTRASTVIPSLDSLMTHMSNAVSKGFCVEVMDYLVDACGSQRGDGSKTGGPNRTILYGLQRPPLNGSTTLVRIDASLTLDLAMPILLPFLATNARDNLSLSVDPSNTAMASHMKGLEGVAVSVESEAVFEQRSASENLYNVLTSDEMRKITESCTAFPLAGQFVSLLFPLGHIKSTRPDDEAFVAAFSDSPKWLRVL